MKNKFKVGQKVCMKPQKGKGENGKSGQVIIKHRNKYFIVKDICDVPEGYAYYLEATELIEREFWHRKRLLPERLLSHV